MDQGSPVWHQWRGKGLGSSDASVVMGIDPYRTREDLLLDKTGRGKPVQVNEAMRLGSRFEGAARALLYFEFGFEFEPAICNHPDFPYIRASLDGLSPDGERLCEIKYMGQKNFDKIKETQWPLDHHYPQVQHQLLAKGLKEAVYAPYTLAKCKTKIENIQSVVVVRNDQYINDQLLPALQNFWGEVTEWIKNNS